jgi:hypothetical protein
VVPESHPYVIQLTVPLLPPGSSWLVNPQAKRGTDMLRIKVWFWSLGLFFMLTFALSVIWEGLLPGHPPLHRFTQVFLPGFHWLTVLGLLAGLLGSFLWGAYFAVVFVPIHNFFYARHHAQETHPKSHKKAA